MLERSSEVWHTRGMVTKLRRPRDPDQLAKLIVDMATGDVSPETTVDGKNPAAVALGRKGGLIGGRARAEALTAKQRSEISRRAAKARWKKNDS